MNDNNNSVPPEPVLPVHSNIVSSLAPPPSAGPLSCASALINLISRQLGTQFLLLRLTKQVCLLKNASSFYKRHKKVVLRVTLAQGILSPHFQHSEHAASEEDQSAERKNERSDGEGVWRSEEAGIKETDVNKDDEERR